VGKRHTIAHKEVENPEVVKASLALRGEGDIDRGLLDEAVVSLNHIHASKGMELAREMGEYVVQAFFGGDLDAFHMRGRGHTTFRALAERKDLHVAYTTIWYSVKVLDQLRRLPARFAEDLPFTHHKLLLTVVDEGVKARLATRAVEKGLSSRELAAEVRKVRTGRKSGAPRGRPRLPAFVRGMTRLRSAVELATSETLTDDAFENCDAGVARKLAMELEALTSRLTTLRDQVLKAVRRREKKG
jgi:hypothetical protein